MEDKEDAGLLADDKEDVKALLYRIQELESREKELIKEKEESEYEFGHKRAKLKELFVQKEEELALEKNALEASNKEKDKYEAVLKKLQTELDEARSMITIAECQKENEIEAEKRKCQEEIASLQHIMKEAVAETTRNASGRYEKELSRLKKANEKLEGELSELKSQPAHEREGVLATVTKTLKQRVGGLSSPIPFASASGDTVENLEESMRKAQEDAEMLRSLVVPLEEEIKALKDKLRSTDESLRMYETAFSGLVKGLGSDSLSEMVKGKTPAEVVEHLDEKLTSLNQGLQAEKASRSDLEMYVAVLNTQKAVIQEDMDRIKQELQEVCQLLEKEKREHASLKRTWQMANDQFLEAQRLQIMDMRRMQSVLTSEQQRQIAEMQRKDAEALEQQRSARVQVEKPEEETGRLSPHSCPSPNKLIRRSLSPMIHRRLHSSDTKTLENELSSSGRAHSIPANLDQAGRDYSQERRRSLSSSAINGISNHDTTDNKSENAVEQIKTLLPLEEFVFNPVSSKKILNQDQLKALSDLTPEQEVRKSLIENARAETETFSVVGKRLVSQTEWQLLEEELRRAREKLGQPCQMCSNYEFQLQQVQQAEQEHSRQSASIKQSLDKYKEDLQNEQKNRQEIEEKFAEMAKDSDNQIKDLQRRFEETEKILSNVRDSFTSCYAEVFDQLKQATKDRESMKAEVVRLQEENYGIIGKHIAQAQQMQNEIINFPDKPEEMEFYCLKLHEDLITAVIAKERTENSSKSEILFLKNQLTSEQTAKERLEDTLMQEIDSLREQLGIMESLKTEMDNAEERRANMEKELTSLQKETSDKQEENDKKFKELDQQHGELTTAKATLEGEIQALRAKVQSLQTELDNSEAVQRDFVKLSQSLQMELEKIRQSDSEVRRQHEDDVLECNSCKKLFHSRKEKMHCNHCGKIFCGECASKTVISGPKQRSFRVCNVCHTLLVHDTAPYFSSEPPQTPS